MTRKTLNAEGLARLAQLRDWLTAGVISRDEYERLTKGDPAVIESRTGGALRGILHRAERKGGPS